MIVQIYEIQTPDEAEKCIALGVDRIGSVILSETKWQQPQIKELIRLSRGTAVKNSLIPLFGERDILFKTMDYYQPHYVHFCESLVDSTGQQGDLAPCVQLQTEFKKRFPEISIIRSIPIPASDLALDFPTLAVAAEMESCSDLFLIDTWTPKEPVKGYIGITGQRANWKTARRLVRAARIPVLLAGGLSPENVYDALLEVRPAGADSCTHTNRRDENGGPLRFKKDFKKVEAFVKEVRRAERKIKHGHEERIAISPFRPASSTPDLGGA